MLRLIMICELETHYFIVGNFYYLIDQVLNAYIN